MGSNDMANLVILESPAKALTIKGYLGSNYKVIASKGHIRDLPKSSLGVDIENGFTPHYINIRGKGDIIAMLKREAKSANKIYLATDPDREGEAISWHLASALGIPLDKVCRVTFNEITKNAVKNAVKNPRKIDMDVVNSQQARRILDRIVGYQLSPFLWKNVKSGLSAGRVQSVATRILCEREDEIRAFISEEYWTIGASLLTESEESVVVRYILPQGERLADRTAAEAVCNAVRDERFVVRSVKTDAKSRQAAPPFNTSTLLQEASKKLGFQPQHIMKVAQELYEGINLGSEHGGVQGLITYMRTDSLRVSEVAQEAARTYIVNSFGVEYCPEKPNVYKTDEGAQDAHEAIRPAWIELKPDVIRSKLSADQYKLYKLIWERFLASQMTPAVYDTVTVDISAGAHLFRVGGYTVRFRGYTVLYDNHDKEELEATGDLSAGMLPLLKAGDVLTLAELTPAQHFTKPPARYTDATLIKMLKESGIGRPSTYATIIATIVTREYVKRTGQTLVPTSLGEITTKLMKESFPDIVDYEFTAQMEDKLDSIEHGGTTMQEILEQFYVDFKKALDEAMESAKKETVKVQPEESNVVCEKCGSKMVYKSGRYGKFLACPNYPSCRNTLAVDKDGNVVEKKPAEPPKKADFVCETCGADVVIRTGRYGEFYACSNYPTCKFTKPILKEIGVACPKCNARIIVRHSRDRKVFYSCERYPDCDYSTWDMPVADKCPDCGGTLVYKKSRKSVVCSNEGCGYQRQEEMAVID